MQQPKSPSHRWFLIVFVAVAMLSRIALIARLPIGTEADMKARAGDEKSYFQIAHAIVDGYEFAEGYLLAYRPPLYPAFIAVHVKLFEEPAFALQIVQNILFLVAVTMLSILAARLRGLKTGVVTATLLIMNPLWLTLPQTAYSETIFLAIMAIILLVLHRIAEGRTGSAHALLFGSLIGLFALTREMGLIIGVLLIVTFFLTCRSKLGQATALRVSAIALGASLAIVGVWTVRNALTFHEFIPIATNGPINLYIGNNPAATGDMVWALPAHSQEIWNTPSVQGENEIAAMRLAGSQAIHHIFTHPRATAALWSSKLARFWFPTPGVPFSLSLGALARFGRSAFYLAYTLLAGYGCWLHRATLLARAIALVTIVASLLHMITFFNLRFRAPFDALLAVPVAWAVIHILTLARAKRVSSQLPSAQRPAPSNSL